MLVRIARYTSTRGLSLRRPVEKQYAILVAFLLWAHEKTVDELINLFDLCLASAWRNSQRELKEHQLAQVVWMQRVVGYFQGVTAVLLDEEIPDAAVRDKIYERVAPEILQATLMETRQLLAPGGGMTLLDFFDRRYGYFRRFAPAFLQALEFHHYAGDDSLLQAVAVLCDLNDREGRLPPILKDVPTAFVPAIWKSRVLNKDGTVNRRDYELCVLAELRDALRSGALWVAGSRRYASLGSYLIPQDRWPQLRTAYCELVGVPEDGRVKLAVEQADLERRLAHFDRQLPTCAHVRLEEGRLILSPLKKEPAEMGDWPLAPAIGALLPSVQSAELMVEADQWTHFSDQ